MLLNLNTDKNSSKHLFQASATQTERPAAIDVFSEFSNDTIFTN